RRHDGAGRHVGMDADIERLRPGHGELVEIGAHHDAAAERALVGIEHEALCGIGLALGYRSSSSCPFGNLEERYYTIFTYIVRASRYSLPPQHSTPDAPPMPCWLAQHQSHRSQPRSPANNPCIVQDCIAASELRENSAVRSCCETQFGS